MADMIRRNWITTVLGAIVAVAGIMQYDSDLPLYAKKTAAYIMIAANAGGLIAAADSRSRK